MLPGALAAMAAVLLSGRSDWWPRVAWFGFLSALGWSFGGSISYMQVIGYTHSGHSGSVLYGFACLFLIGFLWAAPGGAGAALPAVLDRRTLTQFVPWLLALFAVWWGQDWFEEWFERTNPAYRHESPLYWYDTDWLAALLALGLTLVVGMIRRRLELPGALIFWMAAGWWAGFLLFVVGLGWRMTPPRGDNWAGCTGMVIALCVFLKRRRLDSALWATLVTGFIGGLGFATAALLKLLFVRTGWSTNWHSVLEQSYGLINGLGVAFAMWMLSRRTPPLNEDRTLHRWTEPLAASGVVLLITYLNLRKNPGAWSKANAMADQLGPLESATWFNLAYSLLAATVLIVLYRHLRQPIALLSCSWAGKGQLLFLVLLWWMVIGNFERALVSFAPQRLITEGVIFLNATLVTLLVLIRTPAPNHDLPATTVSRTLPGLRRTLVVGVIAAVLSVFVDWAVIRAVYGNQFAGHAGLHIRFGPDATATKEKPKPGQLHP